MIVWSKANTRFYPTRCHFSFKSMIGVMMPTQNYDLQQLRAQIAATAARMVAQDGADYATARKKAARQVLGVDQPAPNLMPDNTQSSASARYARRRWKSWKRWPNSAPI
jgi:hypothetical protein